VQEAMASQSSRLKAPRDVVAIACDPSFFDNLGTHLDAMLPPMESGLVLQCGSATLSDAMYCFGRQYQSLCVEAEDTVIGKLEKLWARLAKPLRILAMWLHPSYTDVARTVVNFGGVDIMNLIDWIDGYAELWGFKDIAFSASLAVHGWFMRCEPWVKRSGSFGKQAGKCWDIVLVVCIAWVRRRPVEASSRAGGTKAIGGHPKRSRPGARVLRTRPALGRTTRRARGCFHRRQLSRAAATRCSGPRLGHAAKFQEVLGAGSGCFASKCNRPQVRRRRFRCP
jgi:hypothetical protein